MHSHTVCDYGPFCARFPCTRFSNLHLNTGHGTLGWTMAGGSGRVMADLIAGRKPEVDVRGLGLERY